MENTLVLNLTLIATRIIASTPLILFIMAELKYAYDRGSDLAIVRRVTVLMAISAVLLVLNLVVIRAEHVLGLNPLSDTNTITLIATSVFWGAINWYALVEFKKLRNRK